MKKSMGLLFSAAVLGVSLATIAPTAVHAADAAPTAAVTKATIADKKGTVYRFAYGKAPAIATYTDAALTKKTDKAVANTSVSGRTWLWENAYDQVATDDQGAVTAYHFAEGWAAAKEFYTEDPTQYKIYPELNNGTVTSEKPATVYADPQLTKATGKTLPAGSRWRINASYNALTQINGSWGIADTVAYNLGGNQWVSNKEFTSDAGAAFYTSNNVGDVLVTNPNGAKLYSDLARTKFTGRTLSFGSRWQAPDSIMSHSDGTVGWGLGGLQYVNKTDVSPVYRFDAVFTVRYKAHPTWGIAVYNSKLQVTKTIPANSRWRVFKQLLRRVNGTNTTQEYYNIGGDQWVRSDYGTVAPK
ncbi:hypothetical protein FMM01_07635 [Schleiferilactobacillus harbinensis]|uniref:hypothetical protein n=1 Tax=Schleiferilactobacillus harbinensis TaxID=304207 RepID=UPI00123BD6C8|nr:hypothetical protein [Schleiferilactobacillus harbinensis]QEU47173.1 hypothetical protein FMM01_07635 [Schleiferilactobacillus harbinensis]